MPATTARNRKIEPVTKPNVHLISLVGGFVRVLPHMLCHYRDLGVSSFMINLHKKDLDDPVAEAVARATAEFGCGVWQTYTGRFYELQEKSYRETMAARPDDWFIIADQDELQHYPDDLFDLIAWCDKAGYDFIRGCFVDRVADDGCLKDIGPHRSLWDQFPIGGMISYPVSLADPRKIVAAKGMVRLALGQHRALNGVGCPIRDAFVQVHHFKWTSGIYEHLKVRVERLKAGGHSHWVESARMLAYLTSHDQRFDLSDPRFMARRCSISYDDWPRIAEAAEESEYS